MNWRGDGLEGGFGAAQAERKPILLWVHCQYCETPDFFERDVDLAPVSQDVAVFVRAQVEVDDQDKFTDPSVSQRLAAWGVKCEPVVLLLDGYGNLLATLGDGFSAPGLAGACRSATSSMAAIERTVRRDFEAAEKAYAAKSWRGAVAGFLKVARGKVRGFPECEKAEQRLQDLETLGREQLTQALAQTDDTKRRDAIEEVRTTFKGLPVSQGAADEIAKMDAAIEEGSR